MRMVNIKILKEMELEPMEEFMQQIKTGYTGLFLVCHNAVTFTPSLDAIDRG